MEVLNNLTKKGGMVMKILKWYWRSITILFVLGLVFIMGFATNTEAKPKKVKIGVALALSGPTSTLGQAATQGLKLAVEQFEDQGGFEVAGEKYVPELLISDTGGVPANGVSQAEKLVHKDKVKVIFGCTYSPVAVPMLKVTQPNKVIQLSNSTSWEKHIAKPGNDYMIKHVASQTDTANSYIPVIVKKWNIKTAVEILPNNTAGRIYAETYANAGKKNGVEMLKPVFYDLKQDEFYPILTKIKQMNPDSLWLGYTNYKVAVIVRQAHELKIGASLVALGTGSTGVAGDLPGGGRVDGFTFCSQYDPNSKNPMQIDLMKRYKKMFKKEVSSDFNYILWYNTAMHLLADAMQKVGSISDTTGVMSFILGKTYENPYGYPWIVDKTGLNHYNYYMGEIKDGKDVFTFVPLVR
jgi:branched-chain amino acid transport system substrate-binding protein